MEKRRECGRRKSRMNEREGRGTEEETVKGAREEGGWVENIKGEG